MRMRVPSRWIQSSGWGAHRAGARALYVKIYASAAVNTCIARAFRFIGQEKRLWSGHQATLSGIFLIALTCWWRVDTTRTMLSYSGRRTRIQRLTSKLLYMFRETKALHLSWYINWYRFLVRAFAESIWRRMDPKGGLIKNKLATTSTDTEFG